MLSRRRRIPRQTFPSSGGFVVYGEGMTLRVVPLKEPTPARFSAVISKKVAPTASARHLWKRRVYEAVAQTLKQSDVRPGSYVFFAKKGGGSASYRQIADEVDHLIEESGVLIEKRHRAV